MKVAAHAMLAALALAGCASRPPEDAASAAKATAAAVARAGIEARLKSLDSAVTGKIRFLDRGDGVTMLVSMINMPQDRYRIVLHETPNCTSPNGFSAGAPWAPPGAARDPRDIAPALLANSEGNAEASLFIRGLHTTGPDGIAGHSVVVYVGTAVTDARPGVPNNRVACGTFEATEPYQF